MFYRPGGTHRAPNRQYDEVYADFIDGATDWLPVNKGNWVGVNICRASIIFHSETRSDVHRMPWAPEVQVLLECKSMGGQPDHSAWPIDQWQNLVVATGRRINIDGWIRLRILNINNVDGTGVSMKLQVSRSGDVGAGS